MRSRQWEPVPAAAWPTRATPPPRAPASQPLPPPMPARADVLPTTPADYALRGAALMAIVLGAVWVLFGTMQ